MFSTLRKKAVAATAVVGSALTAGVANATESGLDVSEATSALSNIDGALVAVGGTLIGLAAVAVGFKWVKGMIFS